jgi:hypothetical protein
VGLGPETHNLGGFGENPNLAILSPIEENIVANGIKPLPKVTVWNKVLRLVAGFTSNLPSDVIQDLLRSTKAFRVSKSATFARGF